MTLPFPYGYRLPVQDTAGVVAVLVSMDLAKKKYKNTRLQRRWQQLCASIKSGVSRLQKICNGVVSGIRQSFSAFRVKAVGIRRYVLVLGHNATETFAKLQQAYGDSVLSRAQSYSQPLFDLLIELGLKTQVLRCLALAHAFLLAHPLSAPDCGNPIVLERQHYTLLNLFYLVRSTTSSIKLPILSGSSADSISVPVMEKRRTGEFYEQRNSEFALVESFRLLRSELKEIIMLRKHHEFALRSRNAPFHLTPCHSYMI
ncbi:hypothetical protein TNCV_1229941 [Trichonephila clavipes]|nr:hypothetical protein TNCV_1229941 [Trichonephila clavipes]